MLVLRAGVCRQRADDILLFHADLHDLFGAKFALLYPIVQLFQSFSGFTEPLYFLCRLPVGILLVRVFFVGRGVCPAAVSCEGR